MTPRHGVFLASGALALLGACSSGNSTKPTQTAPTVRVTRSSDETFVTIDQTTEDPVNSLCTTYCERSAACWYARPDNPDLMLSKEEIVTRCRRELADCRTPSTDTLCCADITDCYDFNRCQAGAHDVPMTCERARGIKPK